MFKILIADKIDLSAISVLKGTKYFINPQFGITNEDILKNFNDYDVLIIRSRRKLNSSFIRKTNIKIIATCSKGFDHIAVNEAAKKKIKIIYSVSGNSDSAAEHTIALILETAKKIKIADSKIRHGNFLDAGFERFEIKNKKIGIIGFGEVGSRVGKILLSFGAKIYPNDINNEVIKKHKKLIFYPLDYILENCDIISIHIPLNEKNKNFFSKNKLNLFKNNSIFINTSRGEIADEQWLLTLLEKRKIKYAGIDVFKNEPDINGRFMDLDNVILTNHIAGKTSEAYKNILNEISLKVKYYLGK